jgi:formate hydrogenlyase subunit 4
MRRGQSIFQPYYNLFKLFSKGEVISETSSWIFKITPFIVISSTLAGTLLIPLLTNPSPARHMGDFLGLIFIFSLGRFFLALSALDTGSAFGGMGSSREMFISSLVEPVMLLSIFSISLQLGSTDISDFGRPHVVTVSSIITAIALFIVMIAETSRIPVDNQETHLELTMVHEAMVLEYSGKSLALIETASYIKQMIFFFIIGQLIFPAVMPLGIIIIALIVALVEVMLAKMRLFRVPDLLALGFALGIMAVACSILGV